MHKLVHENASESSAPRLQKRPRDIHHVARVPGGEKNPDVQVVLQGKADDENSEKRLGGISTTLQAMDSSVRKRLRINYEKSIQTSPHDQ